MTYNPKKYESYPYDNQSLGERAGLESIPRYLAKDSVQCTCSIGTTTGDGIFVVNFHPKISTKIRYFEFFSKNAQNSPGGTYQAYAIGIQFELNIVDFYSGAVIKNVPKAPGANLNTSSTFVKTILPLSTDTTEVPITMNPRYLYSLTFYCTDSNQTSSRATFLGRSINDALSSDMTVGYSQQTSGTALKYDFIPYVRLRESI